LHFLDQVQQKSIRLSPATVQVYAPTMPILIRSLAALLALLALVQPARAEPAGPLVLAAASMQEALTAAADAWAARRHPRPVLSFAGTPALARQVQAGAPADLFVSADAEWADTLQQQGLLAPGTRRNLAVNALVLVAPAGSRLKLYPGPRFPLLASLGAEGRLAMADPDSVPAGRYGRQALTRFGLWDAIAPRVARAENVRAALALVARGAAPLGVVYATDARAEPAVRVVGVFPAGSHPPIVYPIARLAKSTHPDAEPFRRFLLSGEGRAILRRFGFVAR
jgi:molybdate transport system substrate-binding protein